MEGILQRPGKIDWKSLLARTSKKDPGFERIVRKAETVSGLVVSVGVINPGGSPVPDTVLNFVRALGGTAGAAYRTSEDEFALIWHGERDAPAQQRLARISQELWDFQLGSLGDLAILFSWGGAEVDNEPIEEALAIASMRMHETRRGRKALMTGELRVAAARPS
jgi:hypothetical protein